MLLFGPRKWGYSHGGAAGAGAWAPKAPRCQRVGAEGAHLGAEGANRAPSSTNVAPVVPLQVLGTG